jgi:alkanesulfonate monooxygenase SsuD/methylene tetrahydromethanopterin reductase-like flavin-dependent oxidoreductase (luciferase family)
MKFGFMSEGETPENESYYHRYMDLIREVQWAEEMGFDFFASSEQHFTFGATISAPECLYSYLFPLTKRIRFRHAVALLPQRINHPLRVAERIATEDILSGGRIELGVGRANTSLIVKAFQVNPEDTRDEVKEGLDIIRHSFTEEPFQYKGRFFDIPKRYMIPQPMQRPYPPLSMAATSPDSMEMAAREGLGAMASSYFFGWQWIELLAKTYRGTINALPEKPKHANYHFSPLLYAYCAETDAEARRDGFEGIYNAARLAAIAFSRLAQMSKSYGYMAQADDIADKIKDPDWLIEESGTVLCGSPDTIVRQIRRFVELGADEVIIRLDGVGHEKVMRELELFGRHVIPQFNDRFARVPVGMVKGGFT